MAVSKPSCVGKTLPLSSQVSSVTQGMEIKRVQSSFAMPELKEIISLLEKVEVRCTSSRRCAIQTGSHILEMQRAIEQTSNDSPKLRTFYTKLQKYSGKVLELGNQIAELESTRASLIQRRDALLDQATSVVCSGEADTPIVPTSLSAESKQRPKKPHIIFTQEKSLQAKMARKEEKVELLKILMVVSFDPNGDVSDTSSTLKVPLAKMDGTLAKALYLKADVISDSSSSDE